MFTRTSGVWTEQQKLTASDGEAGVLFGFAVAVDGDTVVIGALGDSANGVFAGASYVFTRDAGVWTEQQKLTASDGASMDFFGNSIAVDGNTMLIAADGGGVLDGPGSVYVFTRSAGIWTEQQKLSPSDGGVNDEFGLSVSVDGSTAVIGSHWHDAVGEDSGAAYVFTRSAGVWTEQQKLTPAMPRPLTSLVNRSRSMVTPSWSPRGWMTKTAITPDRSMSLPEAAGCGPSDLSCSLPTAKQKIIWAILDPVFSYRDPRWWPAHLRTRHPASPVLPMCSMSALSTPCRSAGIPVEVRLVSLPCCYCSSAGVERYNKLKMRMR